MQAYKLFLAGKRPVDVAIALNIGEAQVSQFYAEYSGLVQLEDIIRIYEELKGNVWYLVDLRKACEAQHLSVQDVIKLLKVTNNDLPSIRHEYEFLRKEVNELESKKVRLEKDLQDLDFTRAQTSLSLATIRHDCDKEMEVLLDLQQQTAKQKTHIKNFQSIDKEYIKITKANDDQTCDWLHHKIIPVLAFYLSILSTRNDPDNYDSIIHANQNSLPYILCNNNHQFPL